MAKKGKRKSKRVYNTSGLASYRAITSAIRENYRENGVEYTRWELRQEYHKQKEGLKNVPLNRIKTAVEGIFAGKANVPLSEIPAELILFDWYKLENILKWHNKFFKEADLLTFDLSLISFPDIEFEYRDYEGQYRSRYPEMSQSLRHYKYPRFRFVEQKGRHFTWILESETPVEVVAPTGEKPTVPTTAPTIEGKGSERAVELEKEKQKTLQKKIELTEKRTKQASVKVELSKQRMKEITQLKELYKEGLITKKQFQKRFDKLS